MNNTVSIFEKQFPKIQKNHVVLEYCKPFRPSELSKEDSKHIGEYTRTLILETLKKRTSHWFNIGDPFFLLHTIFYFCNASTIFPKFIK